MFTGGRSATAETIGGKPGIDKVIAAMSFSSVSVIGNALRLRRVKL